MSFFPRPPDQSPLDDELCSHFLNVNAYCDYELLDPETRSPVDVARLARVFSPSMAAVELSREPMIPIPPEVRALYQHYRPTTLFRARAFERALATDCEIYVKSESSTPSGNHKANSAIFITYLCKQDGVGTITTETTGNWGLALAMSAHEFGIELVCFIDTESNRKRPDRKPAMERLGARVIVVDQDGMHGDLLTLSADSAVRYTQEHERATYIFGSIYGYFTVPQTIIGLEAKKQLARLGKYPDVVVGSCGGGANLLGTASAFIVDRITSGQPVEIISAESEHCPIVSSGQYGLYSIDTQGYYPLLNTYGLPGLNASEYIGGLGSTILSSAVACFHRRGLIEPRTYTSTHARTAAAIFHQAEGIWVALETGYQIAAVVDVVRRRNRGVILVNISAGAGDQNIYASGAV